MDYRELDTYKILIALGCKDTTGHVQAKKGVVQFSIPDSVGIYHFDYNYKLKDGIYSKAIRKSTAGSPSEFFYKLHGVSDDYDLAFKTFILNFFKIKIENKGWFRDNEWVRVIDKNKKKIFERIFNEL